MKYNICNFETKFIIAPHETKKANIERLISLLKTPVICYTEATEESVMNKQVLIVDTIGILSSIYKYADLAYIGGGFGVGIANRETTDNIYIINSVYANVYEGSGAGGDKITFPTIGTELAEVSLKPHEVKIINVPFYVTTDAQDGTYVYNLEVTKQACTGNCRIGKLQKLYLEVK